MQRRVAPAADRADPSAGRPRPPASLDLAVLPDYDLADEATYRRLGFDGIDLSGQEADSVEFEQCRFTRATLAGVGAGPGGVPDCLVENSDWANLKATKSTLLRVTLSTVG